MSQFRNYRKKNVQAMRPYVPGEDLTGVSVGQHTPEPGGMIAVAANNPQDIYYVDKQFFEANYELADLITERGNEMTLAPHQQRVVDEKNELVNKIVSLRAFILGDVFGGLDKNEQGRLTCQLAIMAAYQEVLQARIAHFS